MWSCDMHVWISFWKSFQCLIFQCSENTHTNPLTVYSLQTSLHPDNVCIPCTSFRLIKTFYIFTIKACSLQEPQLYDCPQSLEMRKCFSKRLSDCAIWGCVTSEVLQLYESESLQFSECTFPTESKISAVTKVHRVYSTGLSAISF